MPLSAKVQKSKLQKPVLEVHKETKNYQKGEISEQKKKKNTTNKNRKIHFK
jgi:hypothetical protein